MAIQPSEIIRQMLVEAEIVILPKPLFPGAVQAPDDGVPQAFTSSLPDNVDTAMLIKTQQGLSFGREMRTGKTNYHPGVRIQLRSVDDTAGYAIMVAVYDYFDAFVEPRSVLVNETYCQVHSVYNTSDIIPIGEEAGTRRQMWTLDLRIAMEDTKEIPLE